MLKKYVITYTLDGTYETTDAAIIWADDRDVLENNLHLVLEARGLGQTEIGHIKEDKAYSICRAGKDLSLTELLAKEYGES